jgi:hypothetical protein
MKSPIYRRFFELLPSATPDDVDAARQLLSQAAVAGPSVGLHTSNLGKRPWRTQRLDFVFSRDDSVRVAEAAKAKGPCNFPP